MEGVLKWLIAAIGGSAVLFMILKLLWDKIGIPAILKFIAIGTRSRKAKLLTHLADEFTDDLIAKYPNSKWIQFLDEAIDKLIIEAEWEDLSEKRITATSICRSALSRKANIAESISKEELALANEKLNNIGG